MHVGWLCFLDLYTRAASLYVSLVVSFIPERFNHGGERESSIRKRDSEVPLASVPLAMVSDNVSSVKRRHLCYTPRSVVPVTIIFLASSPSILVELHHISSTELRLQSDPRCTGMISDAGVVLSRGQVSFDLNLILAVRDMFHQQISVSRCPPARLAKHRHYL